MTQTKPIISQIKVNSTIWSVGMIVILTCPKLSQPPGLAWFGAGGTWEIGSMANMRLTSSTVSWSESSVCHPRTQDPSSHLWPGWEPPFPLVFFCLPLQLMLAGCCQPNVDTDFPTQTLPATPIFDLPGKLPTSYCLFRSFLITTEYL